MGQQLDSSKTFRLQLLEEMRFGAYAEADRLPPENMLSERLGISRTQLRDVLAALEREGFITRRHGVGTVINRHVLAVEHRMDMAMEFIDIIREHGREPGIAYVEVQETAADEKTADTLKIPVGTELLEISRLCTADGQPAIYCVDLLPKQLFRKEYTKQNLESPIYTFLPSLCGVSAYMDLTEVHAVAADETVAQLLQIPVGTAVMNLREVDFDIEGHPLFVSDEYFIDELFSHTVLRKKF